MQTTRYARKVLIVDAVQVTEENMLEVAKWCKGKVYSDPSLKNAMVIEVKVLHPLSSNQTKAQIGDWVLKSTQGFKIYADSAFKKGFDVVPEEKTELTNNVGDALREKLGDGNVTVNLYPAPPVPTELEFKTPRAMDTI